MKQALHIFKKDIRFLWLEISISLAAVAGFTFTMFSQAQSLIAPETRGTAATLLAYLLPVTWCVLVARVVYAEPLCGDRQFWVTRPYERASLLAAKALFVAVFVNLPKLASDAVIIRAHGFRIASEAGGLLWSQVLLTALLVLPLAALSAITTGIVQLLAVISLVALAVAGWNLVIPDLGMGAPWLALEWTRSYSAGLVVMVAAVAIILRQYVRKGTAVSRFLAGGAVMAAFLVLLFFPWPAAFALQSRLSSRPVDAGVRIDYDPNVKWGVRAFASQGRDVDLQIPLRISGIPPYLYFVAEGIAATVEGPGGAVWRTDHEPRSHVRYRGQSIAFCATVAPSFYEKVKNDPVRIRGSVYLTLYGNPRSAVFPIRDRAVFLPAPGVGLCAAVRTGRGIVLNCRSAFRSRPDLVTFNIVGPPRRFTPGAPPMSFRTLLLSGPVSYSPFPADASLVPVTQSMQIAEIFGPISEVRSVAHEPVAYIRKDFEITGPRLAESEAGR
jgi:hypothetical protein